MPACAQGSSVPVTGIVVGGSFWVFWVLLGGASLASLPPLCVQGLGHLGVPSAGHALWAEVGGGVIFVTSRVFSGQHTKLPNIFLKLVGVSFVGCSLQRHSPVSMAIMHAWVIGLRGHSREIAGKNKVTPFLFPERFFSV